MKDTKRELHGLRGPLEQHAKNATAMSDPVAQLARLRFAHDCVRYSLLDRAVIQPDDATLEAKLYGLLADHCPKATGEEFGDLGVRILVDVLEEIFADDGGGPAGSPSLVTVVTAWREAYLKLCGDIRLSRNGQDA